jgi:hypothetical protein
MINKKTMVIIVCTLIIMTSVFIVKSHNDNSIQKIAPNIAHPLSSTTWLQLTKLRSPGSVGDGFGCSVSISGGTVLIGTAGTDNNTGSAYVFTRTVNGWTQQAELFASNGQPGDYFGISVFLSGDTALIGAIGYPAYYGYGTTYVFTRTGASWTQQAQLNASDATAGDTFGISVSLSGDTALIGAAYRENANGSAYVFTRTGSSWTQQAELTATGGVPGLFGYAVSLSGDTALIGAYAYQDFTGKAYVFTRSGSNWTQQAQLEASDGAPSDCFGGTVSVYGDTALIGAYTHYGAGSAYVFTRTGTSWVQQAELHASDGASWDAFGWSVYLSHDVALIGAPGCSKNRNYRGAVYVFTRTGNQWVQQQKLRASDGVEGDGFGSCEALDNLTAVISALYDDDKGSVYIFINEKPPNAPMIYGPANGKPKQSYDYMFNSTDPNYDNVSYFIDWGDNTTSGWIGPYVSGVAITQSHTWSKKGTYTIKAKAKDVFGNESGWGTFIVTIEGEGPILKIQNVTGGLLKAKTFIKNIGDAPATSIYWTFGSANGTIPSLVPGQEQKIASRMLIGFGKKVLKITARCAGSSDSKDQVVTLILIFVLIR